MGILGVLDAEVFYRHFARAGGQQQSADAAVRTEMLLGLCERAATHALDPLATKCRKVAVASAVFPRRQFLLHFLPSHLPPLHLPLAQGRAGLEGIVLVPSTCLSVGLQG